MNLRPFLAADQPQVVALWHACGLTRPWNDPAKDIARKLTVQPELFLVIEDAGPIVASAMFGYDGHRGWVNYLAVAPSHRRRGLLGCPKLILQVRAGNAQAIAFYEHLGYATDEAVSLGKRLIADQ
ncbi:MAG TPA: GNAT family acetyltransferase [Ottowia sp.]|uniref:GNAT family acetyltransferase n=1 Tax=Ottowia sp. TaxID=1898956 RepID=UPI002C9FC99E|nr:GNAT family acetyltransferase [Ottowia sp.]HRN07201.1 GNAT family acetyltransferase [Ottowia sp.]